jgi:hypothetical protein
MFVHFSITTKRHSCCSSFPSGNQASLFGSTSCGSAGLNRAMRRVSNTVNPNIDPHHGLPRSFGHSLWLPRDIGNSACHKPPTEWQLVAGDLTRAGAQRPSHHRDGSVQNAITYLCIGPGLHNCSKDALYGSERLVLRRSLASHAARFAANRTRSNVAKQDWHMCRCHH